jgi:hypothetical protein
MTQAENLREQATGYHKLAEAARAVAAAAYEEASKNIRSNNTLWLKEKMEEAAKGGKQAIGYDRQAERLEGKAARLERREERPWWWFLPIPSEPPK